MNYFKDLLKSINDYAKIILLIFIIEKDCNVLNEAGLSDDFIDKFYKRCTKVLNQELDNYNDHIKNLEESILEKLRLEEK